MKNLELENCGLQELSKKEMSKVEGGLGFLIGAGILGCVLILSLFEPKRKR